MCVVNVKDVDKGGPQRVTTVTDNILLYESDYAFRDIAVLHFKLPGLPRPPHTSPNRGCAGAKPYAIVATCHDPGVQGTFSLSIYSDALVSVEKIPDLRFASTPGQWVRAMAGGSHVHDTWKNNPQFLVRIPGPVMTKPKLRFRLVRQEAEWRKQVAKDPIGCLLGLYVFKGSQRVVDRARAHMILESTFLPGNYSEATLDSLRAAETSLVVVCTTFNPNKIGQFTLEVSSNIDIWVEPLRAGPPATADRLQQRDDPLSDNVPFSYPALCLFSLMNDMTVRRGERQTVAEVVFATEEAHVWHTQSIQKPGETLILNSANNLKIKPPSVILDGIGGGPSANDDTYFFSPFTHSLPT